MVDERLREKVEAFLHATYCAWKGSNKEPQANWGHHVWLKFDEPRPGAKWRRSPKIRIVDKHYPTIGLVEAALCKAGVDFSVIQDEAFRERNDGRGGRTIILDERNPNLMRELDHAVELLPEARTESKWKYFAHCAIPVIRRSFTDKHVLVSPNREMSFVEAMNDQLIASLTRRLSSQLKREFNVVEADSENCDVKDRRIAHAVTEIVRSTKRHRIENNRSNPDYPIPKPDGEAIDKYCKTIETKLREELARTRAEFGSRTRAEMGKYVTKKPGGHSR